MSYTYTWPDLPTAYDNKDFEQDFRTTWTTYQSNLAILSNTVNSYAVDYIWADATARNAETGMTENQYGLQLDTGAVYKYTSPSWVLIFYQMPNNPFITSNEATTNLTIDNTATDGDPQLKFSLDSVTKFTLGVDDSDSDKLKIGTTAVGTGTVFTIDSTGDLDILRNITLGGTVDGVDIAALNQIVGGVTEGEMNQIENIGSLEISATEWGYLAELDQSLIKTADPTFAALTVSSLYSTGNITTDGTVDGHDIDSYLSLVTTDEFTQIGNIGTLEISATEWGYLAELDQSLKTTADPTFGSVSVTTLALSDNSTKVINSEWFTNKIAELNLYQFKGTIDCSSNPNYPAADAGDIYIVPVGGDGKIGGTLGEDVESGDTMLCVVDSSPAGDQSDVGVNWVLGQANLNPSLYALLSGAAFTGDVSITGGSLSMTGTDTYFMPPSLTTAEKEAMSPTGPWILFDETLNELQLYSNASWGSIGGGGATKTIDKTAHGFDSDDIGKLLVKGTGAGVYVVADADDETGAEKAGYLTKINSANQFTVIRSGYWVFPDTDQVDAVCGTTGGFTEDVVYFLDLSTNQTADVIYTTTADETNGFGNGNIKIACILGLSATECVFLDHPGVVLGGGTAHSSSFDATDITDNILTVVHGQNTLRPKIMFFDADNKPVIPAYWSPTDDTNVNSSDVYISDEVIDDEIGSDTWRVEVDSTGVARTDNLSDSDPEPVGTTASAGTSEDHSRADHVHGAVFFSAYLSADQTGIATSSATKVSLDTIDFDSGGFFNNTGSEVGGIPAYSYMPDIAGYYLVSGKVGVDDLDDGKFIKTMVYKGAVNYIESLSASPGAGLIQSPSLSAILYLNGSTDYISLWGYHNNGNDQAFEGGATRITYMSVSLIAAGTL